MVSWHANVVVVYIAAARLAGTTTKATGFFDVELLELDALQF